MHWLLKLLPRSDIHSFCSQFIGYSKSNIKGSRNPNFKEQPYLQRVRKIWFCNIPQRTGSIGNRTHADQNSYCIGNTVNQLHWSRNWEVYFLFLVLFITSLTIAVSSHFKYTKRFRPFLFFKKNLQSISPKCLNAGPWSPKEHLVIFGEGSEEARVYFRLDTDIEGEWFYHYVFCGWHNVLGFVCA